MKLLLAIIYVFSCSSGFGQWHSYEFDVMGTRAKVEIWESNEVKADRLIKSVVEEMNRIERLMSPYIANSELSKLNREASSRAIPISPELFSLLRKSIEFSHMTHGAFDITYASVGFLYDYRAQKEPSDGQIKELKNSIDFMAIDFDEAKQTIQFSHINTKIDLGGIAKGYAVDRCIELLAKENIKHAFVQAGGDSRLLGDKQGRLWTIGIRHPRKDGEIITQLPLENVAVSTSGDYERFFIKDKQRVHHIIDPSTGRSSAKSISVTIIARDSTTADALSTSVFVLGPEKGLALINQLENVSAIIIDGQGKFEYSNDLIDAH